MADTKQNPSTNGQATSLPLTITRLSLIRNVTRDTLAGMNDVELSDPQYVEGTILQNIQNEITLVNAARSGSKWKALDELLPVQIAEIIAASYPVVRIMTGGISSDSDYDLLAIYQEDGDDEGIYMVSDEVFRKLARKYNYSLSMKQFDEMMNALRDMVPRVQPCREPNLIAVNNGIFDFDTKILMPFSKEYVFMSKSRVDYNPNATNITIHNDEDGTDWDIESWMSTLSDDEDVVETLWQVLGAIIRPNVPWGKSAWFYSESGNNGKGTLCSLMRNLCGEGTYCSISLSDFSKDFMLEPLTHSSAIIVDENDVGTYIDRAANLKAVVTGDVIQINRKFKQPIAYQFRGFMVQCLNEMPRIKDKSDSFFRRQLFIPFTKCFTGAERKYIKQDYLKRKEVLEYVMFKVLNMDYYELSTPEVCKEALAEYKTFNDPTRQFLDEILPQLQWDLVPFTFLRDLYAAWYKKNINSTRDGMKSMQVLTKDIVNLLKEYPEWECEDPRKNIRPGNKMDKPEWMIDEYKLEDWYSQTYKGPDRAKKCCTSLKSYYRGIVRVANPTVAIQVNND